VRRSTCCRFVQNDLTLFDFETRTASTRSRYGDPAILRHANVSTTATYIKTAADDVKQAMEKLENQIPQTEQPVRDAYRTLEPLKEATDQSIQ